MEAASAEDSMRWRVARSLKQSDPLRKIKSFPRGTIMFSATAALVKAERALAPVLEAESEDDLKHALEVLVYEGAAAEVSIADFFPTSQDEAAKAEMEASGLYHRVVSLQEAVYRSTKSASFTKRVRDAFEWVQLLAHMHQRVVGSLKDEGAEDEASDRVACLSVPEIDYAVFRETYAYLCSAAILVRVSERPSPGWRDLLLVDELRESLRDPLQLLASLLPESDDDEETGEFGRYVLQSIERPALDIVKIVKRSAAATSAIQAIRSNGRNINLGPGSLSD